MILLSSYIASPAGQQTIHNGASAIQGIAGAISSLLHSENTAAKPKAGSANAEKAGKPFSETTKDKARDESGNKCVFCGKETTRKPGPDQSNIDHSIPKSRGDDNTIDNAQNTCRTCNLDKGTQTTGEYNQPNQSNATEPQQQQQSQPQQPQVEQQPEEQRQERPE